MGAKAERIIDELKYERGERAVVDPLFEEIASVLSPERAGGFSSAHASSDSVLFDTTPILAKRGLTNAIGAMLRPKSAAPGKWFDMVPDDEDLLKKADAKEWVERAEDTMWKAVYNPIARFMDVTGEVDDDIVAFGNGAGYVGLREDRRGLFYRGFHPGSIYPLMDEFNQTQGVLIVERVTAKQASDRWGKSGTLHKEMVRCLTAKDAATRNKMWDICWSVQRRFDRDPRIANNLNMPWESVVVDVKNEHEILEEGFEEFPFFLPRWDVRSGSKYGRGIGILALPDAQTLNQMGKTLLRALHRAVDPSLLLPSNSLVTAPNLHPGGVTYYDAKAVRNLGMTKPFVQLDQGGHLPWGLDAQTRKQEHVFALFFRNILNLPVDGPDMTATEVIQRREEFIREIGSVFGRMESDYTGPIIDRTFKLMLRAGAFGPVEDIPEELRGHDINFRFASPVEKAKRQIEEATVSDGMRKVLEVGRVQPAVMDPFDWVEYGRFIGTSNDFPQALLLSEDDLEAKQARDAEAAQAAKDQEQAMALADTASKLPPEMMEAAVAGADEVQ